MVGGANAQTTISLAGAPLYCPFFDFSKSVRANAHNPINIHESRSSLILSVFYIVIRLCIIIIIIILSVLLLVFSHFLQKHLIKKAPPPVLSSVKMTNMHSYMVTKFKFVYIYIYYNLLCVEFKFFKRCCRAWRQITTVANYFACSKPSVISAQASTLSQF